MPFITTSLYQALTTGVFLSSYLTAASAAQQCFFPDGSAAPGHVPCSTSSDSSACCGSNSYCMVNGLCYNNGIMSRGSCTDATWGSAQCGAYCKAVNPSASVNIMPCSTTEFTCGFNATNCATKTNTFAITGRKSLVLTRAQVEDLVSPMLQSESASVGAASATTVTVTASASSADHGQYTAGDMAGLALGLALPLLLSLVAALILLRREKQKHAPPKLMYKLPDNHEQFDPRDFRPLQPGASRVASPKSDPPSLYVPASPSLSGTYPIRPDSSASQQRPFKVGGFIERYDSMRKSPIQEPNVARRHELETSPPYRIEIRHELSSHRMSS